MFIRALNVLGVMALDGTCPIWAGSTAEVDDATGKRLIGMGAAVEVSNLKPCDTQQAAPDAQTSISSPDGQNAPEGPLEPENEMEELEGVDLESMSFNDLKAYAKELGIDTGKIKSKAGMIEAISALAEEGVPADDLPDLSAQDIVD